RHKHTPEVHIAALNDIMFFLMLFFLLASAVANPQVVKLLLPKSSDGEQSVAKQTMTVSITADLLYHVDKQPVSLEQLEPIIRSSSANGEELTIMSYADSSVPIQHAIAVLDLANRNGVRMVLGTEPK